LNYYVYYKVSPERVADVSVRVRQLFQTLEEQTGVRGRWMRRRDDPATYMEVYEGVRDEPAFEALLEREGSKVGVSRKVECFISAETPA
jgi:hypothetical protein